MPHAHDNLPSLHSWFWLCCGGVCPVLRVTVSLPMALTIGHRCPPVHPTGVRRPPQSGECWFPTRQPTTTEHAVMGYIWSHPPPHTITRRRMRCQSTGRDALNLTERTPQLTPTDPSRTIYPQQLGTPVTIRDGPDRPLSRNETVRPQNGARSRPLQQKPLKSPWDQRQCCYYEGANAWAPHDPSSRTGREAEHDSEDPFSVEPFTLGILVCCWPLLHRLTQRQYHASPVCSQSLQSSPDPHH